MDKCQTIQKFGLWIASRAADKQLTNNFLKSNTHVWQYTAAHGSWAETDTLTTKTNTTEPVIQ